MNRIHIVGAGLAGLSAAIRLAQAGAECDLISFQPSERAQSVLAEGGINGALNLMGEDDSPQQHFQDTMRGGVELADPAAVAAMTQAAPEILRELQRLGVPFNRENGHMIQRNFGGQKKKRTAFAKSSTGKILMSALIDQCRRLEAQGRIHRWPHHLVTGLNISGGQCLGLWMQDRFTGRRYDCPGPVLLCCGGMNGMFPGLTTGTTANTGDLTAMVLEGGGALANLEFIQYHPTTAAIAGKRLLVSEAARGEGGRLYIRRNGAPWYFMEELYPELGNLMPRDVISREMETVLAREDCEDPVYLDLTGLSPEVWAGKLPDLREEISRYLHLDPAREPVPVSPGIHFFMGGIYVDAAHRTSLSGLYAAGECACQYHGANRLGGNSMLGAIFGGQVAAQSVLADGPKGQEPQAAGQGPIPAVSDARSLALCQVLSQGLGIFRQEERLLAALDGTEALLQTAESPQERRRILLGQAMLHSALARKESRGAHTRLDFPDRDDLHFQKTTVAQMDQGRIRITFRPISEGSVTA